MISQTTRKFTPAAAAAVLMATSLQAGANGWMQVASAGGNFSVMMPGAPKYLTKLLDAKRDQWFIPQV